jgi:hypothetical protein
MKLTQRELEYLGSRLNAPYPGAAQEVHFLYGNLMKKLTVEVTRRAEKKRKSEADVRFTKQPIEGG